MSPSEHNELVEIREAIRKLDGKVDRVDEAIRGDGEKPGINGRLTHLEHEATTRRKLIWLLVGACFAAGVPTGLGIAIQLFRITGAL